MFSTQLRIFIPFSIIDADDSSGFSNSSFGFSVLDLGESTPSK